jgi:hypothetical protein
MAIFIVVLFEMIDIQNTDGLVEAVVSFHQFGETMMAQT